MTENNQTIFQVGDTTVTIETYEGEVVSVTAVDEEDNPYAIRISLGREPINGGGCINCTWINGIKKCWDIPCSSLVVPEDEESY